MANTVKVGQTWMFSSGNLFRIVDVHEFTVKVRRVGYFADRGETRVSPGAEYVFSIGTFRLKRNRKVSSNPDAYDSYLSGCKAVQSDL